MAVLKLLKDCFIVYVILMDSIPWFLYKKKKS